MQGRIKFMCKKIVASLIVVGVLVVAPVASYAQKMAFRAGERVAQVGLGSGSFNSKKIQ